MGEKQIVRGDVSQAENLGCNGGADIGAHNDTHRLLQLHNTGVDKAYAHDGGGGRAVDQAGDKGADEDAHEQVVGQPFQNGFQPSAGQLLQSACHGGHAKEKGGNSAQKGDYIVNTHQSASRYDRIWIQNIVT